ncbi:hypothetical protein Hdeb2414_s0005g00158401 [Helianthus debilis subsp. tardiflorus]
MGRGQIQITGCGSKLRLVISESSGTGVAVCKLNPNICMGDTSGHYNIVVSDHSPEVADAMLFACFSVYASCLCVHLIPPFVSNTYTTSQTSIWF